MTADPPEDDFERQRREAMRDEQERQMRQAMRDLHDWASRQPPPGPGETPADPLTILRARLPTGPPGIHVYVLARWSLCARLALNATEAGLDDVQLGHPLPGDAANPGACPPGALLILGITTADGEWHPARPRPDEP
jgi:hypothetical protein